MKKIGNILLALLLLSCVCVSSASCMLIGFGNDTDQLTKEDVLQMIDNSMKGNITVEGGDNLNITINSSDNDSVLAAGALLSTVSIDCVFKTSSLYPSGFGSTSKEKTFSGSGVIYKLDKEKGDAYIITNYHVVYYNLANTQNGISNDISVYLS